MSSPTFRFPIVQIDSRVDPVECGRRGGQYSSFGIHTWDGIQWCHKGTQPFRLKNLSTSRLSVLWSIYLFSCSFSLCVPLHVLKVRSCCLFSLWASPKQSERCHFHIFALLNAGAINLSQWFIGAFCKKSDLSTVHYHVCTCNLFLL